jgi:hypothetical protein
METVPTDDVFEKGEEIREETVDEKFVEEQESVHRDASWGAIISLVVILVMIVVGAFYAWGQRVAQEHNLPATSTTQVTY